MKFSKEIYDSSLQWGWLIILSVVDFYILRAVFMSMPLVMMLTMGEGANSPLYTDTATFFWILTPVSLVSVINVILYRIAIKTEMFNVAKSIVVVEAGMVALYIAYIIYFGMTRGYRI